MCVTRKVRQVVTKHGLVNLAGGSRTPNHAVAQVQDVVPDHVPEDGHVVAHGVRGEMGQAVSRYNQLPMVTVIQISLKWQLKEIKKECKRILQNQCELFTNLPATLLPPP